MHDLLRSQVVEITANWKGSNSVLRVAYFAVDMHMRRLSQAIIGKRIVP